MKNKIFYAIVRIEVESETELTSKLLQHVASEMDYSFIYDEDGVRISKTEIVETGNTPADF